MAIKDETRSSHLDIRKSQTTNLFLLQDLEDGRKDERALAKRSSGAPGRRRLDQDFRGQTSQGPWPCWARLSLRARGLGT
jgi:hypothetical protein